MKLKPETPIWAKLRIMQLENECEHLKVWMWRLTIAIELLMVIALATCVVHFYAVFG